MQNTTLNSFRNNFGITTLALLLFLLCILFTLSGCNKPKTMILFNHHPITKETLLKNATEFKKGERIYFIFLSQKPLKTEFMRVRILKREEKFNAITSKIMYSNDFRLTKDQIYYFTDYIVMNEAGSYCMAVYNKERMERPLAIADFKVKDF